MLLDILPCFMSPVFKTERISCSKDWNSTLDIDECATQTHNCSAEQKCLNFEGGFVCIEQCREGFALNHAGRCEDVDECATGSPCIEASEVCKNTEGGFECNCRRGFEKNGALCTGEFLGLAQLLRAN